jgi:drug/metabolite transporter (DMT)-like permease
VKRPAAVDVMLLVTVLLWAFNYTSGKYALTHGFEPLAYASLRYTAAALLFGLLALYLERSFRITGRRHLLLVAAAAVFITANQVAFVYALRFTSATTVAVILGSAPIFTAVFGTAIGIERLTGRFALAAAASFGGVALVAIGTQHHGTSGSTELKGVLLSIAMSASWAAYSVVITPLMRHYSPYRISAVVLLAMAVPLAALAAPQLADQNVAGPNGLAWAGLAYAVLGPLVLTNVLWFTAIHRIGPSRASLFANLQPFAAAIFALFLLGEHITGAQIAGAIAIGGGILLSRGGPPVEASHAE